MLVAVGGFFVGTRDNKRFAPSPNPVLDGAHTVGATLWAASIIPLLLVAFVWFVSRGLPRQWAPAGREIGLLVFIAAAIVMPMRAYISAAGRLVTTQRRYDSPASPLILAGGAVAFFFVPLGLLVFWWLPHG
jgi:hypothetical protein